MSYSKVTGSQTTSGPGVYAVQSTGLTITLETFNHWSDTDKFIVVKDATGQNNPNITIKAPNTLNGNIDGAASITIATPGEALVFVPTIKGDSWSAVGYYGGAAPTSFNPALNFSDVIDKVAALFNIGGAALTGSITTGNIAVGNAAGNGVADSGFQATKLGSGARIPTTTDDIVAGFAIGSIWVNTTPGNVSLWVCSDPTANAAVRTQATPTPPVSKSSIGLGIFPMPANTTNYFADGGLQGTTQNFETIATVATTFSNLVFRISADPGAGLVTTATFYKGTPGAMTAQALTTSLVGNGSTAITSPTDTTHSVTVSAGQAWAVQLVTPIGAAATGTGTISLLAQI